MTLFQEFADHEWSGAWVNQIFRNESGEISSELIVEALQATRHIWGDPPAKGMVTFINEDEVELDNPGFCFKVVGFEHVGYTKVNELHALQLKRCNWPEPEPPRQGQLWIDGLQP